MSDRGSELEDLIIQTRAAALNRLGTWALFGIGGSSPSRTTQIGLVPAAERRGRTASGLGRLSGVLGVGQIIRSAS